MAKSYKPQVWLLLLLLLTSGCKLQTRVDQASHSTDIPATSNLRPGQSFVSRYAGLQSISVYLTPGDNRDGQLALSLYSSVQDPTKIRTTTIGLSEIDQPGFYAFTFEPIPDSNQKSYYFELALAGNGEYYLGSAPPDTYLDGAYHQSGEPVQAQLAFTTGFHPTFQRTGIFIEIFRWIIHLLITGFVLILPGWGLAGWLWNRWNTLNILEKSCIACGISIASYALIFLWTDLFNLSTGNWIGWLLPAIALLSIIWKNRERIFHIPKKSSILPVNRKSPAKALFIPGFMTGVLVGLLIFTRLWQIRSLDAPLWGDSVHHAMITQLLTDQAGLLDVWEPYAELTTFSYHFAFHSLASLYQQTVATPSTQAILWIGQVINICAVLVVYLLVRKLSRNPWAGAGAILVAGLLSPLPSVYLNWGRYTQLAGLVILPVFMFLVWEIAERKVLDWKLIILAGITLTGIGLAHYRILIFAILFMVTLVVTLSKRGHFKYLLITLGTISAIGFLLFIPWLVRISSGNIMHIFNQLLSTPANPATQTASQAASVGNIFKYLPAYLWGLILLVIGWGILRREKGIWIISIWWLFIIFSANPQWLFLPGVGSIGSFTVLITSYLPVGILIGAGIGWGVETIEQRLGQSTVQSRRWTAYTLFSAFLVLAVLGAYQRIGDLDINGHALLTRPDIQAADWIDQNTDQESQFLVNSFFAFQDQGIVGADGGWWLSQLANRSTNLPPINYAFEKGPFPGYIQWTNELPALITELGIGHPQVIAEIKERGITHLYIGQRQGSVNNPGDALLKLDDIKGNPRFKQVYHQDLTWIFQVE